MGDPDEKYFKSGIFGVILNPMAMHVNHYNTVEGWMRDVNNDLQIIFSSRVGNRLLRSIRYFGRDVFISPWWVPGSANNCDAVTAEQNYGAEIRFTPRFFDPNDKCVKYDLAIGGYSVQSNEVLLHELTHAFRFISGKFKLNNSVQGGLVFYDNKEEFIAVLVQGIYASERKRTIRSSHTHHLILDRGLDTSFEFFKSGSDTYRLIKEFCLENPGFTRSLAEIDVPFNPVKAYYSSPAKAKEFSDSESAKKRDRTIPIMKATVNFLLGELT